MDRKRLAWLLERRKRFGEEEKEEEEEENKLFQRFNFIMII